MSAPLGPFSLPSKDMDTEFAAPHRNFVLFAPLKGKVYLGSDSSGIPLISVVFVNAELIQKGKIVVRRLFLPVCVHSPGTGVQLRELGRHVEVEGVNDIRIGGPGIDNGLKSIKLSTPAEYPPVAIIVWVGATEEMSLATLFSRSDAAEVSS